MGRVAKSWISRGLECQSEGSKEPWDEGAVFKKRRDTRGVLPVV